MKDTNCIAELVLMMINTKINKEIYLKRTMVLLEHYKGHFKELIGDIKLMDTVDTSASMAKKLFNTMYSYTRQTQCSNNMCTEPLNKIGNVIISLNAFDGCIILQNEMDILFKSSTNLCKLPNCGFNKNEILKAKKHLLVELISVPKGKYYFQVQNFFNQFL